jgi:predicted DNA-binding transcriptional regulator
MYVDVHCSSVLRSLVSNRVEWYVECGLMSREVSYVEWLGFLLSTVVEDEYQNSSIL